VKRSIIWRTILFFGIVALCVFFLYPTIRWYRLPVDERIEIGKVDVEEDPRLPHLEKLKGLVPQGYEILLQRREERKIRRDSLLEGVLRLGLDLQGGMHLVLKVEKGEEGRGGIDPVDVVLEILRRRIDEFGVSEPSIYRQGEDRIIVQLPGLKDPERAIEMIGKTALLEFKIVENDKLAPIIEKAEELGLEVPEGLYLVRKEPELTGEYIQEARVGYDIDGMPCVNLTLDREGARLFEETTSKNIMGRLAIVLDGEVVSAPEIRERISGGRAEISGGFTFDEARDLAIVLRQGALPSPVEIIWQRQIGPSLGQDSIKSGVKAGIVGILLVISFMVVRYKFSGLVANLALFFNILILLSLLAAFGAALTLPGIAGIVLIVGMSVDANVIIFERIKEELRAGKRLSTSVDKGYKRAFFTIFDANLTTIIAAIVLLYFGTGPIRGFATTLIIGIVASMFTAIFATRIIFDLIVSRQKREGLSI
jgi:preprotein translocase subunit SecD